MTGRWEIAKTKFFIACYATSEWFVIKAAGKRPKFLPGDQR